MSRFRWRTGQIGPGGGRPFAPATKTYKCVAAGKLSSTGTTAGNTAIFQINSYNAPIADAGAGTFTVLAVTQHPTGHANALQATADAGIPGLGYDRALVLSSMYKFDIHFEGADSAKKDFVFAYKFAAHNTAASAFAADTTMESLWADLRMTKGWAYTQFSAINRGGSMHPSQGTVIVKIPDVVRITSALNNLRTEATDWRNNTVAIADSAAGAAVNAFLHIMAFTKSGLALAANDIIIDVTWYGRVRLFKNMGQVEMVDEVDQVGAG